MQVTKRVTVDGIEFVLGMSDGRNLLKYSLPYAGNTRPMLKALTRAEADAFHKAPFTNARKILRSHGMETDSRVGLGDMRGGRIGVGVDGNGGEAELASRAEHAAGDLTAVRHQN